MGEAPKVSIEAFCDAIRISSQLRERARGVPVREQVALAVEEEQRCALIRGATIADVQPLYYSVDDGEVSGCYAIGAPDPVGFALGLLNQIAGAALVDAPIEPHYRESFWLLRDDYGPAVVPLVLAVFCDAQASGRREYVRLERSGWPVDDDGDEIVGEGEPPLRTAPIGTDDDDFCELGFTPCGADDEHATLITRVDLDSELLAPLKDLIEARGTAAKIALRGEVAADVERLVVAARAVAFGDIASLLLVDSCAEMKATMRELDQASEAFAGRVAWDNEPSDGEQADG